MSKHPLYNTTGLQKNNKSHVLYALANKQMELKQLEDEYSKKIAKIKSDLSALEHTICLFDDDCDETLQKMNTHTTHKYVRRFKKGEMSSLILKALKRSDKAMTIKEITFSIQQKYDFDVAGNVRDGCKILVKKGLIKNVSDEYKTAHYLINDLSY
jgi:hypothetical protein